ncbi:MAG: hypothetical protein WA417_09465 [Stellaceae bacterium]
MTGYIPSHCSWAAIAYGPYPRREPVPARGREQNRIAGGISCQAAINVGRNAVVPRQFVEQFGNDARSKPTNRFDLALPSERVSI